MGDGGDLCPVRDYGIIVITCCDDCIVMVDIQCLLFVKVIDNY